MSELPIDTWVPIAVALLLGAALWAFGTRLVRSAFSAIGFLVGMMLGSLLAETVDLGVTGWIPAVFGGLLLAFIANLAYRGAIATGLALVLGVAAPAGVWVASGGSLRSDGDGSEVHVLGVPEPEKDRGDDPLALSDELEAWLSEMGLPAPGETDEGSDDDDPATDDNGESGDLSSEIADLYPVIEEQLDQARSVAGGVIDRGREIWEQASEPVQRRMISAALVATLLGFILGSLASSFSAALVTASGGSMLAMSGTWLASREIGDPVQGWLSLSPNAWLTWWVVVTGLGLFIQWTVRRKRADKRT